MDMRFRNKGPGAQNDLPASVTLGQVTSAVYTSANAYYLPHMAEKDKMGKYVKPCPKEQRARSEYCIAFEGQTAVTVLFQLTVNNKHFTLK